MQFPEKPKEKKLVYLDHAATTYMDPRVLQIMEPYWNNIFANASGLYSIGRDSRDAIESARTKVASLIHSSPSEIIFTSGGTESDNLAIFGIAKQHANKGKHIISLSIEHHAVLNPLERLQKEGFDVTSNEVDVLFENKAKENAKKEGVKLKTTRFDWLEIDKNFSEGKFDAVLCSGNSLTYLFRKKDRLIALKNFLFLLRKGGWKIRILRN